MNLEELKIRTAGLVAPARWNALVEYVQSSLITKVNGGAHARTKGGTQIWIRPSGGGAAAEIKPFQLIVTTTGGESPTPAIRVVASTLAGGSSTDLGFAEADDPPYLLSPVEGVLQGGITIDGTTGEVTSRWLEIVSTLDDDTDTTFYVEIGTVSQDPESGAWSVTNSRYGPIAAQICRNWYAAEAPFFGVFWS